MLWVWRMKWMKEKKTRFWIFFESSVFLWLARARRVSYKGKTTTFSRGRCSRVGPIVFWSFVPFVTWVGTTIVYYELSLRAWLHIQNFYDFFFECKILLYRSTWQNPVVSGSILICGVGPLHYGPTVLCFRAFLLLVVFVCSFKKKENDTYYK